MRGTGKTITSIVESNPKYLLNWRIRRAARLATQKRLRRRAIDDETTYRCARYLKREKHLEATSLPCCERNRRLAAYDAEIYAVLRIVRETAFRPLNRDLKLRILAQQTDSEIATATGLPSSVVRIFQDLAFSIRRLLPHRELLLIKLLGRHFLRPLGELPLQQAQMLLAYDLGSRHIDLVLALGEPVGGLPVQPEAGLRRQRFWLQQRANLESKTAVQSSDLLFLQYLLKLRAA